MDISNCIEIIGIIVNAILAFWVVNELQKKIDNQRTLKNHFISEVKEIQKDYQKYLSKLYNGKMTPKKTLAWFKLMNIKINNLIELIHSIYGIDDKILHPYQVKLRELITENDDYINKFKEDNTISLSDKSKNSIMNFHDKNRIIFSRLIVTINNAKSKKSKKEFYVTST